jgi:hypothetical protein
VYGFGAVGASEGDSVSGLVTVSTPYIVRSDALM